MEKAMKSAKPPPAPDYAAVAAQQAQLDKAAAAEQTVANRPNQNTAFGSVSWSQDPNGQWTQNSTLNATDQALLDQQRAFQGQQQGIASGLLDRAGASMGTSLDYSGLPQGREYNLDALRGYGNLDLSSLSALPDAGFGAVEQVRDAMMSRLAPARAMGRESEIQRLKNQGIPENSEAFQRALTRLDQGDTDAQQQALLGAAGEYGNIFNRSLQARGQQFGEQMQGANFANQTRGQQFDEQERQAQLASLLRQQGISERQQSRSAPLDDYMRLVQGINPTQAQMPSFMGGTGYQAANQMGAAQNQYGAAMNDFNAQQAQSSNLMSGLFGLGGAALMGPMGGVISKRVGGLFGG